MQRTQDRKSRNCKPLGIKQKTLFFCVMFFHSRTPPISDQISALPGRRLQSAPEAPVDPADQEARRVLWDRCRPASFEILPGAAGTWVWRLVGQELEVVVEEEEVGAAAVAWVELHRIGPLAKYSADKKVCSTQYLFSSNEHICHSLLPIPLMILTSLRPSTSP